MTPNARTARYHTLVATEIEKADFRKPIWEEAKTAANGDERAAEKIYFAKRVEQMERDEQFLEDSHAAKIERENFNDAIAPKRLISKTLLLMLIALLFVSMAYIFRWLEN